MLDLGSRTWIYGFSGENAPRGHVDVSRFGVGNEHGIWTLDCASEWNEDPEVEAAVEARVQEGLRWIFHRELMTDPRTRKVIVAENPLLPTRVKELLARVLFDRLQVRLSPFVACRCSKIGTGPLGQLRLDADALAVANRQRDGSCHRLRLP